MQAPYSLSPLNEQKQYHFQIVTLMKSNLGLHDLGAGRSCSTDSLKNEEKLICVPETYQTLHNISVQFCQKKHSLKETQDICVQDIICIHRLSLSFLSYSILLRSTVKVLSTLLPRLQTLKPFSVHIHCIYIYIYEIQ